MAFYDQARQWYFHDLWKRTLSTWGTGQSWTRVDLSRPGPTLDYPDFAAAQTDSNLTVLAAHGQSGIARRFRWNGKAWVLEAQRATGDTGALDFAAPGNASPFGNPSAKQSGESAMGLAMPLALAVGGFLAWKWLR